MDSLSEYRRQWGAHELGQRRESHGQVVSSYRRSSRSTKNPMNLTNLQRRNG